MVSPAAGKVVLVPFPFSDPSLSKLRPAVVVADAGRGDWVLCQITSNAGLRAGFLVLSGHGRDHLRDAEQLRSTGFEVLSGTSILDAFTVLESIGAAGTGRPG